MKREQALENGAKQARLSGAPGGTHPALHVLCGLVGEVHHHANIVPHMLIIVHGGLQADVACEQHSVGPLRCKIQAEALVAGMPTSAATWSLPTVQNRLCRLGLVWLKASAWTVEEWLSCSTPAEQRGPVITHHTVSASALWCRTLTTVFSLRFLRACCR